MAAAGAAVCGTDCCRELCCGTDGGGCCLGCCCCSGGLPPLVLSLAAEDDEPRVRPPPRVDVRVDDFEQIPPISRDRVSVAWSCGGWAP